MLWGAISAAAPGRAEAVAVPLHCPTVMPPARNADLHGNVPEESLVALVLIDVINDFGFEGGTELAAATRPMALRVAALKARARRLGIPAIYVNDNFGR